MTYIGESGKRYDIVEPAIGRGGEGSVYIIKDMPEYVLKVYNESKRTDHKYEKLSIMLRNPIHERLRDCIAWPLDIVYVDGQFMGCVLPFVKQKNTLSELFSDKFTYNYQEKIVVARNICALINSIHNAGHVCGDLNPNNILFNSDNGKVAIVDTESFHICDKTTMNTYRCEVGYSENLPREIQEVLRKGYNLSNAPLPTFSNSTDYFSLAVIIFKLLMNGCHPYACSLNDETWSTEAPQIADNIYNCFFPFVTKVPGYTIPRYSPQFDVLPPYIKKLFIRAFMNGNIDPNERPDCVEWFNALTVMSKNLKICENDSNHYYSNHLSVCPWCGERKLDLFDMPESHLACILLIDTSSFMDDYAMKSVNEAVNRLKKQVLTDELAQNRVDVAVISFDETVQVIQDFAPISHLDVKVSSSDKKLAMAQGIRFALDKIKERNRLYESVGVPHYSPHVYMFSKGKTNENLTDIIQRLKNEEKNGLTFGAIGVSDYNKKILRSLTNKCISVDEVDFTSIFDWITYS